MIKVENVTKKFGGLTAIDNVSFSVKKGEVLGIIGPNGSGKTTLINCITGFLKPTSGKIFFKNIDITGKKPHKIVNLGIARTFQIMRPYYSLPAYKNLIIPLMSVRVRRKGGWRGISIHGDRDTVAIDILEELGFERDAKVPYKLAGTLPTGYLKRLELGRALCLNPELLICDEIFSGLTSSEIASIVPLIKKLNEGGITIIMIEHRLKELFQVAENIIALSYGEKIAEGSSREVIENEKVREAYLGTEEVF
jgi:branched-chain amino acid transport system ATP-binding protein